MAISAARFWCARERRAYRGKAAPSFDSRSFG
ncbi:hypothetical protein ACVWXN_006306 [Bradyrhizobium sp. i1.4.4]